MEYRINQRLSISDELCTVKYVGEIPNWPNELCLGIEWDNHSRGKNNGTLDDVRYFFTTDDLNSGSFIKVNSKKLQGASGIDFVTGLADKYGGGNSGNGSGGTGATRTTGTTSIGELSGFNTNDVFSGKKDANNKEIKIGSKIVESYGFDKLDEIQSNFHNLEIISLDKMKIGLPSQSLVLDRLVTLDLSFNLFDDLNSVLKMIINFKNLKNLNLSGNKFINSTIINHGYIHTSLKQLQMAKTMINDINILCIIQIFPNITDLDLSFNDLSEKSITILQKINKLKNLEKLEMSFNKFKILPFSILSTSFKNKLTRLIINDNNININSIPIDLENFDKLVELDIRGNLIQNWKEIDNLNKIFPQLTKLRINDNPLFPNIDHSNVKTDQSGNFNTLDLSIIHLLVRCNKNLSVLNRTKITNKERENYELFFISKIKQRKDLTKDEYDLVNFSNTNRWLELCRLYDINPNFIQKLQQQQQQQEQELESLNSSTSGKLLWKSSILTLFISYKDKGQNFHLFKNYTIGKLKGLISLKIFNSTRTILDFKIYYLLNVVD
ncbi:hypothetical protein PACTADRAFT_80141 [Pachysolen tannophilus NRRL Y-2460]|uniref:CAP-Gly domain-containing protein n=1 Tax=Pachysolen tannophilus NRRL Y-2460 TaxID=669874 RepID=A0A1E4TWF8_PACTA|nr:hypothetical protein PACTADRAFT_80141 [Pachysolen tannophilus NRRL Y-2460]